MAVIFLVPVLTGRVYADGISLLADLQYFYTKENSTAKETGIETDTDFSRFSQLYQLDISRQVYPNLLINLGGYLENDDTDTERAVVGEPDLSTDTSERTVRPYIELNLRNPIYKAGLAYRARDTETSGSFRETENLEIEEYDAVFSWRPVDLPLLNLNYQRIEVLTEPLTVDAYRDLLNIISKYTYKDLNFDYAYTSQDNYDNIEEAGNLVENHNGSVRYAHAFEVDTHRFDVSAGAKFIYNTIEFTGTDISSSFVDTPASTAGSPFYILNDSPATSNEPFDITLVDAQNRLTNINIGRGGGLSPVSAGLSFGAPTEVETIYIQLSEDTDTFPDLASPSQVSAIADSYSWRLYSSDDQVELNWTEQPLASVTFNSVDNRFELRLASTVNARRIKVTTVPLTLLAPGEIRYNSIRAFTTVSGSEGREPENLDQYYSFGVQWSPGTRTSIGYEAYYRDQEAKHVDTGRTSLINSVYFRHRFNPVFMTYGKLYRNDRTRTSPQADEDETDQSYSISLKGNYLETLNQTLVFSGTDTSGTEGDSSSNSVTLRTNADVYQGLSMYFDLGYAFNTLLDDVDQTIQTVRFGTNAEPNRRLNLTFDYSINWVEETGQVDSTNQYGTFQALWSLTNTLNMFFRYNFRDQEGRRETSTFLREFNINWAPFPDGDLQLSLGYNESVDFGDREVKTITPSLTWKVARGIFLDLRYNTGTLETPTESTDIDSYVAKLKFYY